MNAGNIAALIAAGAFLRLIVVIAVPFLKLGRTMGAATRAINSLNDQTGPLLASATGTVRTADDLLSHAKLSVDALNGQLAKVDTITGHAAHVTSNLANLSTVVSAAAANPLIKVASFGYGLRKTVPIRASISCPSAPGVTKPVNRRVRPVRLRPSSNTARDA